MIDTSHIIRNGLSSTLTAQQKSEAMRIAAARMTLLMDGDPVENAVLEIMDEIKHHAMGARFHADPENEKLVSLLRDIAAADTIEKDEVENDILETALFTEIYNGSMVDLEKLTLNRIESIRSFAKEIENDAEIGDRKEGAVLALIQSVMALDVANSPYADEVFFGLCQTFAKEIQTMREKGDMPKEVMSHFMKIFGSIALRG